MKRTVELYIKKIVNQVYKALFEFTLMDSLIVGVFNDSGFSACSELLDSHLKS